MYWVYFVGRVLGFTFAGMWLFLGPFAQGGLVRQRGPISVMTYQITADGMGAIPVGLLFGFIGIVWLYVVQDSVRYRAFIDLWLPTVCGAIACLISAGIEPALYALVLGFCITGIFCIFMPSPMDYDWPF